MLLLILPFYLLLTIHISSPQTFEYLDIAVLAPHHDQECTRKVLEMAFNDVKILFKDKIFNPYVNKTYELRPHYMDISQKPADAIIALYKIYFNGSYIFGLVGPAYNEQGVDVTQYVRNKGTITFSYIETAEPIDDFATNYHQTSPYIIDRFQACYDFVKYFKWNRVAILGDIGSSQYGRMISKLVDIFTEGNSLNVTSQYFVNTVSKEVSLIQSKGIRIIIAVLSVQGARMTFCEAHKKEMISPKVVWILFERLPTGWASDHYNSQYDGNQYTREVDCTEDELLRASDGYIAITRQNLRKDSNTTISGMTAQSFMQRIENTYNLQCDESVAHAYDAVWAMAHAHKEVARMKPHNHIIGNYDSDIYGAYRKLFEDLDGYDAGSFIFPLQEEKVMKHIAFDGLTGTYKHRALVRFQGRVGDLSLWTHTYDLKDEIYVGQYIFTERRFNFLPNAERQMFPGGKIPKDVAIYEYVTANFEKPVVLTFWVISCIGILFALSFMVLPFIIGITLRSVDFILIIGCILCYVSVLVYGLDTRFLDLDDVRYSCSAFLTILSVGFTFTCGALYTKAWRIYKIYKTPEVKVVNNKLHRMTISQEYLIAVISILVIIDIILIVVWVTVSPFTQELDEISKEQTLDTITVTKMVACSCEKEKEFMIAMYCYKGVVLFLSVFIAWQVDCKDCKRYTKQLSVAIYNITAISLIGLVCTNVLKDPARFEAKYAIIAVCVFVGTTTTLLLVFVPKIRKALNTNGCHMDSQRSSSSNSNQQDVYAMSYVRRNTGNQSDMKPGYSTTTISTRASTDQLNTDIEQNDNILYQNGGGSISSLNSNFLSNSPPPQTLSNENNGNGIVGRFNQAVDRIDEEPDAEEYEENKHE